MKILFSIFTICGLCFSAHVASAKAKSIKFTGYIYANQYKMSNPVATTLNACKKHRNASISNLKKKHPAYYNRYVKPHPLTSTFGNCKKISNATLWLNYRGQLDPYGYPAVDQTTINYVNRQIRQAKTPPPAKPPIVRTRRPVLKKTTASATQKCPTGQFYLNGRCNKINFNFSGFSF